MAAALLVDRLSDTERERLGRLRASGDRDRFATARVAARIGAGTWWGLRPDEVVIRSVCAKCGGTDHGPVFAAGAARAGAARAGAARAGAAPAGAPPHVSLTHSGDVVAVAVSAVGPVGIDVEASPSGDDPTGPGSMSLQAWVRTEAVLKATGRGLAVDPRSVVVRGALGRPDVISLPDGDDPAAWHVQDLDLGTGCVGAVAVRHGGRGAVAVTVAELGPDALVS